MQEGGAGGGGGQVPSMVGKQWGSCKGRDLYGSAGSSSSLPSSLRHTCTHHQQWAGLGLYGPQWSRLQLWPIGSHAPVAAVGEGLSQPAAAAAHGFTGTVVGLTTAACSWPQFLDLLVLVEAMGKGLSQPAATTWKTSESRWRLVPCRCILSVNSLTDNIRGV